jgi:hypothetical protein
MLSRGVLKTDYAKLRTDLDAECMNAIHIAYVVLINYYFHRNDSYCPGIKASNEINNTSSPD